MMARSTASNKRPDTLMQDRLPPAVEIFLLRTREYFGCWNRIFGDLRNTETASEQICRTNTAASHQLRRLAIFAAIRRAPSRVSNPGGCARLPSNRRAFQALMLNG